MNNAISAMSDLAESTEEQSLGIFEQADAMLDIGNSMVKLTTASINQAAATDLSVGLTRKSVKTGQQALATSERALARQKAHDHYTMRFTSMQAYVRGDTDFESSLYEIRNRLPLDIEEKAVVNGMTMEQAAELQKVVEPIVAARISNNGTFRASMPVWPQRIRSMMIEAGDVSDLLANCYEAGAVKVFNDKELAQIRFSLNTHCRYMGNKHSEYRHLVKDVYEAMVNEVYNAAIQSGANPELEIPDSIRQK